MSKIFGIFRNLPIRRKILVTYLAITLLPVLLLGYFSNKISTDTIIEKTFNNSSDNLLLINHNLDNLTDSLEYFATNLTLLINNDIADMNLSNSTAINELDIQNHLVGTFNNVVVSFPNISSGMFVSSTGSVYGKDFKPNGLDTDAKNSDIVRSIQQSDGGTVWFGMQKRGFLNDEGVDRNKYILTVGKKVFNLRNGSILGSLVLNETEETISSIYKGLKLGQTGRYYIINKEGVIVSSQSSTDIMTPIDPGIAKLCDAKDAGNSIAKINGKSYLIVFSSYQKLNWKVVGVVPLEELTSESGRITIAILTTAAVCLLLSLLASILLSNVISKPISEITLFTKNVGKDGFATRFDVNSRDEVGQLGNGLNDMISNINQLIHDIYVEQKKEKDLELKVLQLQINPHFLYNTLDSLYWQMVLNDQLKSADIVLSLSKLLRYSISRDNGLASIAQELKQLENYISIQGLRFSDKIDFVVNIEEAVNDFCIPKLTFQPIVENSINHGLKDKDYYGEIRIMGKLAGDFIVFSIQDNGIGMSEEELMKIRERSYTGSGTGLGINNVNDRIELLLGLKNAITIQSEAGAGTKVEIRLPLVMWEGKNEQA
jgi:two-component system, sensor histidine kinase YesM